MFIASHSTPLIDRYLNTQPYGTFITVEYFNFDSSYLALFMIIKEGVLPMAVYDETITQYMSGSGKTYKEAIYNLEKLIIEVFKAKGIVL